MVKNRDIKNGYLSIINIENLPNIYKTMKEAAYAAGKLITSNVGKN